MTKKQKSDATNAILITSVAVVAVSSVISVVVRKRKDEKRKEELLTRNVAFASFKEVSELFIDTLDKKIEIAKKALLDDDFNQVIEDF